WSSYGPLGAYLFPRGPHDEAIEMFKQVVALVPDSFRGYSNLGAAEFKKGQRQEAIASFEKSMSIRLNYPAASTLGTLYYFDVDYRRSADAFRQAIAMNSTTYQVWAYLAAASHWAGDEAQATEAYRHAKELAEERARVDPRDLAVKLSIAEYTAELGDKERA